MSLFASVELAPDDPILGLVETFLADPRPDKVNLSIGVYHDEQGRIPLLATVHEVELRLAQAAASRGYLPIDGLP
ncbi:MAG TPA: aromatic amino acid aminotransferase, partial [Rhodanobacter sp.]|nr:aromatic amino acid aminotransferase [Rhodanobacter sp.]